MSILEDSKMGLPLSIVSRRPNSSALARSNSAARVRIRPRCRGFIAAQGPDSNAFRAPATALSRSSFPASATSAIVSPVAGLTVAKRLPVVEATSWPSMKRSVWSLREDRVSVAMRIGRWARLFPFELRHALLLVRGDAFLGVFALEEKLLQLPLDGQC